ncbi:MAG: Na/Pi cotransporter family protein [Oscillospiraceae bacterium]|nr:Na/Pi cotransporter family protein [Oscillospiraceae bacterium]
MDIFDFLTLLGGLCLFLFGMNIMGQSLERSAGSKLEIMLGKLTTNKFAGLLTGLGVTAIIQSSSATTVMVVGFVNSGLMTLRQAIHVIMGANIGTTVTAWILSLSGISGDSIFLQLLKPTSFTPILAVIGIALYMFCKTNKKKDIGTILLGFAVLMFGMDAMTGAVSGLADIPAFQELFLLFKNPILGVVAGTLLTAVIQSSSASVGILQALASTGQVSYGAAIPIIMGQNIGTCITAILASFGTNKNAKRAALVHLSFNVIGTIVWLSVYSIVDLVLSPALFDEMATLTGIATAHSLFNLACTMLLLPLSGLLEKMAYKLVPDAKNPEKVSELDDRLLATPAVALERSHALTLEMAKLASESLKDGISLLKAYDIEKANYIREIEDKTDHYEDIIGSYIVKLSSHALNEKEGATASMMLKAIGDFERISDHAVNIAESAQEMKEKNISFTADAKKELDSLCDATLEIVSLSCIAFTEGNIDIANCVEPLEQVIDKLKEFLRSQHIERLRRGDCSIEAGFVWSDLITNMERVSDHCSNIAGGIIDVADNNMNIHESLKAIRGESDFYKKKYLEYSERYLSFA